MPESFITMLSAIGILGIAVIGIILFALWYLPRNK